MMPSLLTVIVLSALVSCVVGRERMFVERPSVPMARPYAHKVATFTSPRINPYLYMVVAHNSRWTSWISTYRYNDVSKTFESFGVTVDIRGMIYSLQPFVMSSVQYMAIAVYGNSSTSAARSVVMMWSLTPPTWRPMWSFVTIACTDVHMFAIGNSTYLATALSEAQSSPLYEYTPTRKSWKRIMNITGPYIRGITFFQIEKKFSYLLVAKYKVKSGFDKWSYQAVSECLEPQLWQKPPILILRRNFITQGALKWYVNIWSYTYLVVVVQQIPGGKMKSMGYSAPTFDPASMDEMSSASTTSSNGAAFVRTADNKLYVVFGSTTPRSNMNVYEWNAETQEFQGGTPTMQIPVTHGAYDVAYFERGSIRGLAVVEKSNNLIRIFHYKGFTWTKTSSGTKSDPEKRTASVSHSLTLWKLSATRSETVDRFRRTNVFSVSNDRSATPSNGKLKRSMFEKTKSYSR
eukprot:PhF_6_TR13433/c0_g2_i2/m.21438